MLVINKIAWSELIFMSHTTPIIFVDKRGIKFKTTQYCVLNYRVSKKSGMFIVHSTGRNCN